MGKRLLQYRYYGLKVASVFAFPELATDEFEKPDIVVRIGQQPLSKNPSQGLYFKHEDCCLYILEDGVQMEVTGGQEVVVHCPAGPDEPPAWLRSYLLGPVFSTVLHQRGLSLFHGSAVYRNSQAVVILGNSGAGKSTTAAKLCTRIGYRLLADDICAIEFLAVGSYCILPAAPRLKLFVQTARDLGLAPGTRLGLSDEDGKRGFSAPTPVDPWSGKISAFIALLPNNTGRWEIIQVEGAEKATLMLNNMLWTPYLKYMGKREQLFLDCMHLASQTPLYVLHFDKKFHKPGDVASQIVETASHY